VRFAVAMPPLADAPVIGFAAKAPALPVVCLELLEDAGAHPLVRFRLVRHRPGQADMRPVPEDGDVAFLKVMADVLILPGALGADALPVEKAA
jgi:hypothetical protein